MSRPDKKNMMREQIHTLIKNYCEDHFNFGFDKDKPNIKLHEAAYHYEEISAALDCLLDTRVTMGGEVKAFEQAYSQKYNHPYVAMSNSGSSANLLAIAGLTNPLYKNRLQAGDEVIVPALSWSTTIWPLVQNNLLPVLVDCDSETLNIDPNAIEAAIGPKTRAIMIVHVYGNVCDMDAICAICKRHNLILIEDGCESMGAKYDLKPVGCFGQIATFSTYFSHHITSLEGGFCVGEDKELDQLIRMLRSHGWLRDLDERKNIIDQLPDYDPRFVFGTLGYNLRAVEPLAAFGRVQLKKLDQFVKIRARNANYLQEKLERFGDYFTFQKIDKKVQSSYFGFIIKLRQNAPFTRDQLSQALNDAAVETRPVICGNIARQPAMKHIAHKVSGALTSSNDVMQNALSVGIHQHVDQHACDYMIEVITDFIKQF
ncbi:MAG: aminotransferase class V-fold PLP-dependent enzyme [Pseudomonadota bacterium]